MLKTVGLDPESRKHVGKYCSACGSAFGIAQAIMEDRKFSFWTNR